MDNHSLDEFRRRWQEELAQAQALRKRRRPEAAERRPRRPEVAPGRGEQASGYLALAQSLLEGAGRPPAAARTTRAERQESASRSRSPPAREGAGGGEQLVDQLIRDLVSDRRLLLRPRPAPTPPWYKVPSELQGNSVPPIWREGVEVHTPLVVHAQRIFRSSGSQVGAILSSRLAIFADVFGCHDQGLVARCCGQRPGMLMNILQRTGQPPHKIIWPRMPVLVRLRNLAPEGFLNF